MSQQQSHPQPYQPLNSFSAHIPVTGDSSVAWSEEVLGNMDRILGASLADPPPRAEDNKAAERTADQNRSLSMALLDNMFLRGEREGEGEGSGEGWVDWDETDEREEENGDETLDLVECGEMEYEELGVGGSEDDEDDEDDEGKLLVVENYW